MLDPIRRSFKEITLIWGFAAAMAGLFGFIAGLFTYPEIKISSAVLITAITVTSFLMVGLLGVLLQNRREPYFLSPKVHKYVGFENRAVLLTAEADWLGSSSTCSIYLLEGDFELLIGFGRVMTVQQNKKIQVGIEAKLGAESSWRLIEENTHSALAAIVLKPGLPAEVLTP